MKKLSRIFDIEKKLLIQYEIVAQEVMALEKDFEKMSDIDLQQKTEQLKKEVLDGKTIEQVRVHAFATAREASRRVTGMFPFKVQIIGACALSDGNIAEMKTGEGKTLTSVLPAYLFALKNEGVHIVTVNDYLASRDSKEMGEIFEFLGLTVGLNARELSPTEKREQYACDITYTTNSELGFDYLRDNMVIDKEGRVQRGLNNAIVDEVDSILIDEARTPLIISGQEKKTHEMYVQVDAVVKSFVKDRDFEVALKEKTSYLSDNGIEKIQNAFGIKNLFDVANSQLTHAVNQALKANFNMHKDMDYVVKNGQVIIVDQFTGRTMEGRAYSDGLHQAIEAKESVEMQKETKTMATITYQNFFRLYDILAGMTGTAKTEEEEFQKTYSMDVICIDTNQPLIRDDQEDLIFETKASKYKTLMQIIKERHELGQPILIGTVAIETSEEIANLLKKENIVHKVLNAKNHFEEALIITEAGKKGSVSIATNMAGRGTDIKLSDEVKNIGEFRSKVSDRLENASGLMVLGTERHESRRIDNQLRGRSGRQGDPGCTMFLVSAEDDLMLRYLSPKGRKMFAKLASLNPDQPLQEKMLSKSIMGAQREVESVNYEIRKNILKYDDVLREQREVMYYQRDYIIDSKDLIEDARKIVENFITNTVNFYVNEESQDLEGLNKVFKGYVSNKSITHEGDNYLENALKIANEELDAKILEHGEEIITSFCKTAMIRVLDGTWIDHIDQMSHLRQSIGLRGYGQIDPLVEYQKEGRQMFEEMIDYCEGEIVKILVKGRLQSRSEREAMVAKLKAQHDKAVGQKQETVRKEVEAKVGRNEPCPCGSGKKYKQCHGA